MSSSDDASRPPARQRGRSRGRLTSPDGTSVPVDISQDRRVRAAWLMLTAGPLTWFAHFMLVYLVAEAGCTGSGPGFDVFDPPVPVLVTLVATVVAVAICAVAAAWGWRRWRSSVASFGDAHPDDATSDGVVGPNAPEFDADQRSASLAFTGSLLSLFSIIAVLFTGAPALVLGPC